MAIEERTEQGAQYQHVIVAIGTKLTSHRHRVHAVKQNLNPNADVKSAIQHNIKLRPQHMLVKLTFAAVRSVVNASGGANKMILAAIVRATNQSRTATSPIVIAVTVCANIGNDISVPPGTNQPRSNAL